MKQYLFSFLFGLFFAISLFFAGVLFFSSGPKTTIYPKPEQQLWKFQSIDTMKHSRDLAREKSRDMSYDSVIDREVSAIANAGATHVAIATPYDEEFIPYLRRWVLAARRHHIGVWFRGNFSGWEGWFEYPKISREEHRAKLDSFLSSHLDLFRDGDVFSSCPECENGGAGDPRRTGDVSGFQKFLFDEYTASDAIFKKAGKRVSTNFFSMNGDVARLIMDKETTKKLGGVVTVDHYVKMSETLAHDAKDFISRSGGTVVLGEFGAPIPDIHGKMTEEEQAKWVHDSLLGLSKVQNISGVSYWTNVGSSTALWDEKGNARKAVSVLSKFYRPRVLYGVVCDELNVPIAGANVSSLFGFETETNKEGYFELRVPADAEALVNLSISASGFISKSVEGEGLQMTITLQREQETWWFRLKRWALRTF